VNQLCKEFGIPLKNPSIVVEIPTQQSPHDRYQTIIKNSVINTSEIDNDDMKTTKRKREQEPTNDDERPVEEFYFYDHLLN